MAKQKYYTLPDYKTVTTDLEEYLESWRDLARPLEEKLGLTLAGFDPEFAFTKGNAQGHVAQISLPCWFVRDLSAKLKGE